MQSTWEEAYLFVDSRTSSALEKLGLPGDAEKLEELLEEKWKDLNTAVISADDDEERCRRAFVQILERAVGADLENNTDTVKAEIIRLA